MPKWKSRVKPPLNSRYRIGNRKVSIMALNMLHDNTYWELMEWTSPSTYLLELLFSLLRVIRQERTDSLPEDVLFFFELWEKSCKATPSTSKMHYMNRPKENENSCFRFSLVVQSILQHMCALMLPDDEQLAHQFYCDYCELLADCTLIDKTYEITEFDMMRCHYRKILAVVLEKTANRTRVVESEFLSNLQSHVIDSRYHTEFDELDLIARGGFGSVFKACNKLDGQEYAVKKINITLKYVERFLRDLREVKILAGLNHKHIVPYKTAWLEPQPKSEKSTSDGSEGSAADDTPCQSAEMVEFSRDNNEPFMTGQTWTLYIQMALCKSTMRMFLDCRNDSPNIEQFYNVFLQGNINWENDKSPLSQERVELVAENSTSHADTNGVQHLDIVLHVIKQLLDGLNHLHSRGIIHHDIKPDNIFIGVCDSKINVQMADFGLSCLFRRHVSDACGTRPYAAPEQLDGKCDPKSDIYSLGIILLELLVPFKTYTERHIEIENTRHGNCPNDVDPNFKALLLGMLQEQSSIRMAIHDSLEEVNQIRTSRTPIFKEHMELKNKLNEREAELQIKDLELQAKYDEIKKLKKKLRKKPKSKKAARAR